MNRIVCLAALVFAVACTKGDVKPDAVATTQPAAQPAEEGHTNVQPALDSTAGATKAFDHKPQAGEKAICAVSGEPFTVTAETKTAEHEGKWYAFCCDECAPEFAANPAKFAN